jgi:hypothetical protein
VTLDRVFEQVAPSVVALGSRLITHGGVAEWLSSSAPDTDKPDDPKPTPKATTAPKAAPVVSARDANGRIQCSEAAKRAFTQQSGYPKGRPAYVVNHIILLAYGGPDAPSNMQ